MNINKSQLTHINSPPSFNKLLADPTKNVKDVYLPTPEVAAIVCDSKKDFIPQDTGTNIFLGIFMIAWARLKLYSEMDKLGELFCIMIQTASSMPAMVKTIPRWETFWIQMNWRVNL
ncbi:hypothetical protein AVEN_143269-1 [Araneus ventricosus]|uniref:Uncharacterized protein n=1 Tax=Araneus ventricosus TaxID=182803 RepID=A0A4Y2AF42_ARAVE|nr:hypothetical protein AVEN_143269-1 [Araneus ventricosus]